MFRKLTLVPLVLLAACAADAEADVAPRDAEIEDELETHVSQIFAEHDADQSGSLSKAEAEDSVWIAAHFDAADANDDGQVSKQEVLDYAHAQHEASCPDGDCDEEEMIAAHIEKGFEMLDVNEDQQLTLEEAKGQPLEDVFEEADTDDSGTVSLEELHAIALKKHSDAAEGLHRPHGGHGHR